MCLIKEDLGISLTWNKNIIRIILLKLPPQVIIRLFVIIAIEMVTWVIDVMLKEMLTIELNVFTFQKESLLTLNDPRSFGYLKVRNFFLQWSKKWKNKWYLDSGYSRHMTGNYSWFSSFTKIENDGNVSFGWKLETQFA